MIGKCCDLPLKTSMSASGVKTVSGPLRVHLKENARSNHLNLMNICHLYCVDFKSLDLRSFAHVSTYKELNVCEGASVMKKAPCHGPGRAVCRWRFADPGSLRSRVPNFGVTPICDSYLGLRRHFDRQFDCGCTGPHKKDGEKPDDRLLLCIECRVQYNIEKLEAADDMARSFLYMKDNKRNTVPKYHPELGIQYSKLPTCPCGNAINWSKWSKRSLN